MGTFPKEIVTTIFHYTTLAERFVLQLTCKSFREVGNITSVLGQQVINTFSGIPLALYGVVPSPTLVTALERKINFQEKPSPPVLLLLARYLKLTPGCCLKTLDGHVGFVNRLTPLDNGDMASCSTDMTIKVWSSETGQCLKTLSCVGRGDGEHLASLGNNQIAYCALFTATIQIWDLESGKCLKTLDGHTDCVTNMVGLGNGQLISCDARGVIKMWDSKTGQCLKDLGESGEYSLMGRSLAYLGGKYLASGSAERGINIWNLETGQCLKSLGEPHTGGDTVMNIASLGEGQLAVYCADGYIKIWDSKTGQCLKILGERHTGDVTTMLNCGNGQFISGDTEGVIKIWDLETGECLKTVDESDRHRGHVSDLCSLGNGHIASCSYDRTIKIWGYDPEESQ